MSDEGDASESFSAYQSCNFVNSCFVFPWQTKVMGSWSLTFVQYLHLANQKNYVLFLSS